MKAERRRISCALLAAGASTFAVNSNALEANDLLAYSIGPVLLRPNLLVTESYQDNILYGPSGNERDDFVTTVSPGLRITLGHREVRSPWLDPTGREENYLMFGYNFDNLFYAKNSEQNATQHRLSLESQLRGYRLALQGSDRLEFLSGTLGGGANVRQKVDRMVLSDVYTLSYRLSEKTAPYLTGAFTMTDFETGTPLLDYVTYRGTLGFNYKPFNKISFFGETHYGQNSINPNRPIDADGPYQSFVGGFLGARGDFTTRIQGSVKVGYEDREFSDGTEADGSPVVEATLSYRITERLTGNLRYSRQNYVSVQQNSVSYDSDDISLRFEHRLGASNKILASLGGTYEINTYQESQFYGDRQDDWLRINAGISYFIQVWMVTTLAYEFEHFTSSTPGIIDYDANRVTLSLAIGY